MYASDLPSENSSHHGKAITRHSSPTLRKKLSSKLLVTNDFGGVLSEQDKVPSTCITGQPYSKTNDITSSFTNYNDSIRDDYYNVSTRSIRANSTTFASQAFCDNSITCVAVEETETAQRQSYIVLVGHKVRPVSTKHYAMLPSRNKFMVKQREQKSGVTKVKLVLKSSNERLVFMNVFHLIGLFYYIFMPYNYVCMVIPSLLS